MEMVKFVRGAPFIRLIGSRIALAATSTPERLNGMDDKPLTRIILSDTAPNGSIVAFTTSLSQELIGNHE